MKWLNESMNKSKSLKDTYSLHDIEIFIKDPLPEHINMDFILRYIKSRVPYQLLRGVDMVYVGKFKNLEAKQANALYQDGAIYLTNDQDDDKDMIDDIIHEIAHSIEELYGHGIYDDGSVEREFLGKRKRLFMDLKTNNYDPPVELQYKTEFTQEIDDYLYKEVTYDAMWHFVGGLFPSPYAATSIREYFARGFEEYVMGNKRELETLCPVLHRKIKALYKMED